MGQEIPKGELLGNIAGQPVVATIDLSPDDPEMPKQILKIAKVTSYNSPDSEWEGLVRQAENEGRVVTDYLIQIVQENEDRKITHLPTAFMPNPPLPATISRLTSTTKWLYTEDGSKRLGWSPLKSDHRLAIFPSQFGAVIQNQGEKPFSVVTTATEEHKAVLGQTP